MPGGHATSLSPQGPQPASGPPKGCVKRPGSGRRPGVPNKITASVKEALVEAFERMGGVPSLVKWGKKHPGEFYRLWLRLLPIQLTGMNNQPIEVSVSLEWLRGKLFRD